MSNSNSRKIKASDRLAAAHKVLSVLRKKYGQATPRQSLPVLETLLFAACLENVSQDQAEAVYARLLASFHDLNEIRVSSISEIEQVLGDLPQPEWRALRIREVLQFTFENHYSFDLDQLKRKTLDVAEKQLGQIRYLSPFIRAYTLQHCLGAHVVPVDALSGTVLVWLGLVARNVSAEAAAEEMKAALRKNESTLFCHLIRTVATDRKYAGTFALSGRAAEAADTDLATAPKRLTEHLARPPKKALTKAHKKPGKSARKSAASSRSRKAEGAVRKRVSKPKSDGSRKKRATAR